MTMIESSPGGPTIIYVADVYRRYPGESVTFFLRLTLSQPATRLTVEVWLPEGVEPLLERGIAPASFDRAHQTFSKINGSPKAQPSGGYRMIYWAQQEQAALPPGEYEFQVTAQVSPLVNQSQELLSWARVTSTGDSAATISQFSHLIRLQILTKSRRLKYLPVLYQQPEHALMGRYLMIFDYVWDQYEELLVNQAAYFDPQLAPWYFKLWLAEWVGCWQYRHLPAGARRRLLPNLILNMVRLHQQQGTKAGLEKYLAFWLGLPEGNTEDDKKVRRDYIQIKETVTGNFVLGEATRLGANLILGDTDQDICHFKVTLHWPANVESLSHAFLREVIEAWKPAHTILDEVEII